MESVAVTEIDTSPKWHKRLMGKHLNAKQMWRVKCVVGVFLATNLVQFIVTGVVASTGGCFFEWQGRCYE